MWLCLCYFLVKKSTLAYITGMVSSDIRKWDVMQKQSKKTASIAVYSVVVRNVHLPSVSLVSFLNAQNRLWIV